MAARPTWKGYLKISLVTIPIRVFPATNSAATVSFNQLHGECRTRIQQKRWCPSCEREVPLGEIVKGYEFEKGRYVVLSEDDLAKVKPESTKTINLVRFTDDTAVDPMYVEKPYYLAPDGKVAAEAFSVVREGMRGKAGVGRMSIYGREYLVLVQPREKGLVMFTMRHAQEVRAMSEIEELESVASKVSADEVKLARQVIGSFEGKLDLTEYKDAYQEELRRVIDAKIAGEEVIAPAEEEPAKVVNLMDALRRSLDAVSARPAVAKADLHRRADRAPLKRVAGGRRARS